MRPLSKIDVILHKVGVDTQCYKYWNLPKAERVVDNLDYQKRYLHYKKMCYYENFDFTGEYDMYINKGYSPANAYHEVVVEWMK